MAQVPYLTQAPNTLRGWRNNTVWKQDGLVARSTNSVVRDQDRAQLS